MFGRNRTPERLPPAPACCCSCGRRSRDLYRVSPVHGGILKNAAYCPGCYEETFRRVQRERALEFARTDRRLNGVDLC